MLRMTLLPTKSDWTVSCGLTGLSVAFGSTVTGSADGVKNNAEITLALGPIQKDKCRELAPLIGKEVQQILNR